VFQLFKSFLKPRFEIYTDGSHKAKWGSWAFIIVQKNKIIHQAWGRESGTNSHRMEFQAAIEALKHILPNSKVIVHTDSRILLDAVSEKMKRPAVNPDQVEILFDLMAKNKVTWKWVKAHNGNKYNEICDELCRQARL
jgi:ribonuclease HI